MAIEVVRGEKAFSIREDGNVCSMIFHEDTETVAIYTRKAQHLSQLTPRWKYGTFAYEFRKWHEAMVTKYGKGWPQRMGDDDGKA